MADSKLLADIIVKNIREEFQEKHLSGNLADTIRVEKYNGSDGIGYDVVIPAETYDIKEFSKTGKIVYTYNGSYASQVDVTGGFSKEHKDYINRCIDKSVREWLAKSKK